MLNSRRNEVGPICSLRTIDTDERSVSNCIIHITFSFYLLLESNHFINVNASVRLENVCLFFPRLSVNAIDDLFKEIEFTGKLTVIS